MALLGIPDVQTEKLMAARNHQRTSVPLLWAQQLIILYNS
jgi:hypothetical protein